MIWPMRMRGLAALVFTGVIGLAAVSPVRAAGQAVVTRYDGDDRYETATKLALARFSTSSDVLLARGDDPIDGLAANYPAGGHGGPVLLSRRDAVPPVVLDALRSLQTTFVHLMGGDEALSAQVEQQLRSLGYRVDRYAGANRYETAAIAAESNGIANSGRPAVPERTALLAAGDRPIDALVTGPLAWWSWPLLLTRRDDLPSVTVDIFSRYDIRHVVLVGGFESIASTVEVQLAQRGISVERIQGTTREGTATAFADLVRSIFSGARVGVAGASATADALALAGHLAPDGPILLCKTVDDCGSVTTSWLRGHAGAVNQLIVAGGPAVISDAAVAALAAATS
jgi:putative cell wall-binding protein